MKSLKKHQNSIMFVKVNKPDKGANTGSCLKLTNYLNKDKNTEFFSREERSVSVKSVVENVDKNTGQLGKNSNKFYMLSINPSQKELQHLVGREATGFKDLSPEEFDKLKVKLESYTHNVMDIYAKNFDRANIKGGDDLMYYCRIETDRSYHHYDKEVKQGTKKEGDKKQGLNVHIHVIVSRKSKDGTTKLSPTAKSRGNKWDLQGKNVTRGFNHINFKIQSVNQFNSQFNYQSTFNSHSRLSEFGKNTQNISNSASTQLSKLTNKLNKETGVNIRKHFKTELKIVHMGKKTVSLATRPGSTAAQEIIKAAKQLATGLLDKGKGI